MDNNSKIFDSIRVKSRRGARPEPDKRIPGCEWDGCNLPGPHRAPKSHKSGSGFHNFCVDHVRQYNRSFNFFADLKPHEVEEAIARAAATGERATWEAGSNRWGKGNPKPKTKGKRGTDFTGARIADPLNLFARLKRRRGETGTKAVERKLLESDRRALEALGLPGRRPSDEIKRAYKDLVKLHHPDANGGDKGSEDRLRAIIAAYTHLRQKGFV